MIHAGAGWPKPAVRTRISLPVAWSQRCAAFRVMTSPPVTISPPASSIFVGYSAAVGGRDYNETLVPELNLRNIFLPPFESGVRAGAATVMTAFSANDGIPCTANSHLLTGILRGEWGFPGTVISDAGSVNETVTWGFAADVAQAARLCLQAGTDVELGVGDYPTLVEQVKQGRVSLEAIDQSVRRVLRLKFALGLFEHPYTDESAYPPNHPPARRPGPGPRMHRAQQRPAHQPRRRSAARQSPPPQTRFDRAVR